MFKVKCPRCNSPIIKRNGTQNGQQRYLCHSCGRQFRIVRKTNKEDLWSMYLDNKQTIDEISRQLNISQSSVKRILKQVKTEWTPPDVHARHGVIHIDATYFGRNSGVLVVIEERSRKVLYLSFINHERAQDYFDAVDYLERNGYLIEGILLDGNESVIKSLSVRYPVQMCQFHMAAIIRRKLTMRPKLTAAVELKEITHHLTTDDAETFKHRFLQWCDNWEGFLKETSLTSDGKRVYTHRRTRSAMFSIKLFLPYLFTYKTVNGMPNTNNLIEGTFTDLKKNLNNHSGMSKTNRNRFVIGFFLAWNKAKQE